MFKWINKKINENKIKKAQKNQLKRNWNLRGDESAPNHMKNNKKEDDMSDEDISSMDMTENLNPLYGSNEISIEESILTRFETSRYEDIRQWIKESTKVHAPCDDGEESVILSRQTTLIKKATLNEIDAMLRNDVVLNAQLIRQYSFEILSDGEMEETIGKSQKDEEVKIDEELHRSKSEGNGVRVTRKRAQTTEEYIAWLEQSLQISNRKVNEKVKMLLDELHKEQIAMESDNEGSDETFGNSPDEGMYEALEKITVWV